VDDVKDKLGYEDTLRVRKKKVFVALDPETMGYDNHDFRKIDPDTINPADYAHAREEGQEFFGDVREYNTAYNKKHPETDVDLYDLGLIGTTFTTEAKGSEGTWKVTGLYTLKDRQIYIPVLKEGGNEEARDLGAIELGLVVEEGNVFRQVKTKLISRGMIDREQRLRVSTGMRTQDRLKQEFEHG